MLWGPTPSHGASVPTRSHREEVLRKEMNRPSVSDLVAVVKLVEKEQHYPCSEYMAAPSPPTSHSTEAYTGIINSTNTLKRKRGFMQVQSFRSRDSVMILCKLKRQIAYESYL